MVDSVVSLVVKLSRSTLVEPGLKVNKRFEVEQLINLVSHKYLGLVSIFTIYV